jgi:hypothetical protein
MIAGYRKRYARIFCLEVSFSACGYFGTGIRCLCKTWRGHARCTCSKTSAYGRSNSTLEVALQAAAMADGASVMMVQINTDRHIQGSSELQEAVTSMVEAAFGHFADRVTRLEVHLSDQNSHKGGDGDVRCAIEARLAGLPPLGVHHDAAALTDAVQGAMERLQHLIEHHLGRIESL